MLDERTQDRLSAAMAKLHGAVAQTEALEEVETTATDKKKKAKKEEKIDVSDNPVHLIMSDTTKSNEEKINEIAAYLTAQGEDYVEARKRFASFEAYFAHLQSEGMQLDMEGMKGLIERIRSELKPEIEKVTRDLTEVQHGVEESKKLLVVLRTARLEGKTIDEISEAVKLNDRLIKDIERLTDTLKDDQEYKKRRQGNLETELDRKLESEKGFFNKLRRVFGPDKEIASDIEYARTQFQEAADQVTKTTEQLKEMEVRRDKNLEEGPLTILRSVDAARDNFSDQIVKTAEASLKLITGAVAAVEKLLNRTAFNEKAAIEIMNAVNASQMQEHILEGAVHNVAKATCSQGDAIKARVDAVDKKLDEVEEDSIDASLFKVERAKEAQTLHEAQEYEEVLNQTLANFKVIMANGVDVKASASQLNALIQSEKNLLKSLNTEALPATTRALRIVLEEGVVLQTGELAHSISAISVKARELADKGLEDFVETQKEMHDQEMLRMDKAIEALNKASDLMVGRIEDAVTQGLDKNGRLEQLGQGASGLAELLEQFDDILPTVSAKRKAKKAPKMEVNLG